MVESGRVFRGITSTQSQEKRVEIEVQSTHNQPETYHHLLHGRPGHEDSRDQQPNGFYFDSYSYSVLFGILLILININSFFFHG